MDDPVRIDLFGDMIEEIKTFSIANQRSRRALAGFVCGALGRIGRGGIGF